MPGRQLIWVFVGPGPTTRKGSGNSREAATGGVRVEPSSELCVPRLRVSEGPSHALGRSPAGVSTQREANRAWKLLPDLVQATRSHPPWLPLPGPHRPLLLRRHHCPSPGHLFGAVSTLKGSEKYLNTTGVLASSVSALDGVKKADSQAHPRPLETRSAFWPDARVIWGAHGRLRRAGLGDSPYP